MPRSTPTGGDLKLILARIDKRQAVVVITDRALSLASGLSADAVRSMRRGFREGTQKGVSTETIRKLAGPLRTTPEWLLNGVGPEEVEPGTAIARGPTVKIVGEVAAGMWIGLDQHLVDPPTYPFPVPTDPRFPAEAQYGLVMRGTSFDRHAHDGDVVICVDLERAGLELQDNDLAVASCVTNGTRLREITIRRYSILDGQAELSFDSTDPRFATSRVTVPARPPYKSPRGEEYQLVLTALVCSVFRAFPHRR